VAQKYRQGPAWKGQLDDEDRGLRENDTDIPLDLDTSSLAPILAFLEWSAKLTVVEDERYEV